MPREYLKPLGRSKTVRFANLRCGVKRKDGSRCFCVITGLLPQLVQAPIPETVIRKVSGEGKFFPSCDRGEVVQSREPVGFVCYVVHQLHHVKLRAAQPFLLPHAEPVGKLDVGQALKVDGDMNSRYVTRTTSIVILDELLAVQKAGDSCVWYPLGCNIGTGY